AQKTRGTSQSLKVMDKKVAVYKKLAPFMKTNKKRGNVKGRNLWFSILESSLIHELLLRSRSSCIEHQLRSWKKTKSAFTYHCQIANVGTQTCVIPTVAS
ncbi:hypothetical protein Ancab_026324, partial [Ancistrocladus abbreviatus]